jgi:hypothetical protein
LACDAPLLALGNGRGVTPSSLLPGAGGISLTGHGIEVFGAELTAGAVCGVPSAISSAIDGAVGHIAGLEAHPSVEVVPTLTVTTAQARNLKVAIARVADFAFLFTNTALPLTFKPHTVLAGDLASIPVKFLARLGAHTLVVVVHAIGLGFAARRIVAAGVTSHVAPGQILPLALRIKLGARASAGVLSAIRQAGTVVGVPHAATLCLARSHVFAQSRASRRAVADGAVPRTAWRSEAVGGGGRLLA